MRENLTSIILSEKINLPSKPKHFSIRHLFFFFLSLWTLISCMGKGSDHSLFDSWSTDSICSVQSLSHLWLCVTPWTTAHQASLSISHSRSLPKLTSIESVMPSNHLILCHSLLLLPPILPSIKVFSNESALCITWPKYGSLSFSVSSSNEY